MTNNTGNHNPELNADGEQPQKWLNTEELANHEEFETYLKANFPREAKIMRQYGMDRRTFLKTMGASLTLAGFGLQGCTTADAPNEPIIPYVRAPEVVIPGNPLFFASTMSLGGFARGILIETHEARPHRLEGNPEHPASLGGADAMLMASILELYNPDRATVIRDQEQVRSWDEYLSAVGDALAALPDDGAGLRILTETVTSPTLLQQLEDLLADFPAAQWHQYEPISRDNIIAGAKLAFGDAVDTVYRFDAADVVLSLDNDFLTNQPGSLRYARDFISRRQVRAANADGASVEMSRLYAVESTPTSTGATADHRLKLRASEVEGFTRALAAALGLNVEVPAEVTWDEAWLAAVVDDLQASQGSSLVTAGPDQPAIVHALAHAINDELGNVGNTLDYIDPVAPNTNSQYESLVQLTEDMESGDVDVLFILGGNPVYNAPADVPFAQALESVPFVTHLGLYFDETSSLATWHIPQTHFIEEWSDARAFDGTASLVQPPIGPLLDTTRSAHEILAVIAGDDRRAYDILREYWEGEFDGDDFEAYWRRSLHSGVLTETAFEPTSPSLRTAFLNEAPSETVGPDEFEVIFQPDPTIYDGRYANNPWLQELPKPLTKITWDNTALISPATAVRLGVTNEDVIEIEHDGRTMSAAIWIQTFHPDNAVTVSLGYGRGLGADVGSGFDFNANTIRTASAPWFGAANVRATGQTYELAPTQTVLEVPLVNAVRNTTLTGFNENPAFVYEDHPEPPFDSLLPDDVFQLGGPDYSDGYKWGMTIDQTACIGCNACMIACQAENNINTVGKQQVKMGRDMHWIRVDRYDESAAGRTHFQPVPCMHCEKAPCEQVCPVQATVHSHEGLNQMVYNRCVGTRYCAANCPYGVRRFNFMDYVSDEPIMAEVYNPDVSVRERGIMEKCSYCVQRINEAHAVSSVEDRPIADGEIVPACASSCPTQAIVFGDLNNPEARVTQIANQPHNYGLLEDHNTKPRTTYLGKVYNANAALTGAAQEEEV